MSTRWKELCPKQISKIVWTPGLTDKHLSTFRNLIELYLGYESNITDEGIKPLSSLNALTTGPWISHSVLNSLTNLTELSVQDDYGLTDFVSLLSNLTALRIPGHQLITTGIQTLTNLTDLDISEFSPIKGKFIENLSKLQILDLSENQLVKDKHLRKLTNLTCLSLQGTSSISDEAVKRLTNLRFLNLCFNGEITDEG